MMQKVFFAYLKNLCHAPFSDFTFFVADIVENISEVVVFHIFSFRLNGLKLTPSQINFINLYPSNFIAVLYEILRLSLACKNSSFIRFSKLSIKIFRPFSFKRQ